MRTDRPRRGNQRLRDSLVDEADGPRERFVIPALEVPIQGFRPLAEIALSRNGRYRA